MYVPDFGAPTGLRAPATPSLKATPCPRVEGRLEWVGVADDVELAGAGDCVLGVGAEEVFGGPFAQADLCGSGVEGFGADAAEDLLILRSGLGWNEWELYEKKLADATEGNQSFNARIAAICLVNV